MRIFFLLRAEEVKKILTKKGNISTPKSPESKRMPPLGFGAFLDEGETTPQPNQRNSSNMTNKTAKPGLINLGPADYSKEEIAVLRKTSFINSREYVPFMSVDMKERFAFPVQYRYFTLY